MNEILLLLSAICFILPENISEYDQCVNDNYCQIYSSQVYTIIMRVVKYFSILPIFICIYEMGYAEIAWYFKMIIWAVFYFIVKLFGTWLFCIIFGFGRGGALTSIKVLILGIVTLILALTI